MAVLSDDAHVLRFAGGDSFVRSYFEQSFSKELIQEGITHTCGYPYTVKWLDRDGLVFRPNVANATMDATLMCGCRACAPHATAYNYGRVSIAMETLTRFQGNAYDILKTEVMAVWRGLKEHLRNLKVILRPEDMAVIAEELTRMLVLRGTVRLSEVVEHYDLDVDQVEPLMRLLTKMGFVRDPHWVVQVMPAVNYIEVQRELPVSPSFEVTTDPLLALPAEHPLAA